MKCFFGTFHKEHSYFLFLNAYLDYKMYKWILDQKYWKDDIYGLQPWIFSIWFTSLSVNKFIIFWYNLLVHDLGPMMFRSSVVVRVVTLLCKRRIIAFDPYLNSWKGFKTGLEEMWLLLKASLRTKGWIHLKCIGFLWQRHNFVTVTKIL